MRQHLRPTNHTFEMVILDRSFERGIADLSLTKVHISGTIKT